MDIPKREELARELESMAGSEEIEERVRQDYLNLAEQARKDDMPDTHIASRLQQLKLGYFAQKLISGYYERNYTSFTQWINDTGEVSKTTEESKSEAEG